MSEVRVYKPNGELKKVISREAIIQRHWDALPEAKPPQYVPANSRKIVPCCVCNKDFEQTDTRTKCCGIECQSARRKARDRQNWLKANPPEKRAKPCKWCENVFIPKYHSTTTCSPDCKIEWNRKLDRIKARRRYNEKKARKEGKLAMRGNSIKA